MKRYTKEFITAERRQLLEVWKRYGTAENVSGGVERISPAP